MDNTLWIIDIDGTIVNVHKNQVPAWNKALMETYGFTPDEKTLISFFGKPFKSVLRNVALHYGITDEKIAEGYDKALQLYTETVSSHLDKTGGEILPGAVDFLEYLGEVGAKRAIATGNPQAEGEHKLKYFDLLKYFDITVYCDDRRERIEMVEEAIHQAETKFNLPLKEQPSRVIVIGDSLHDVESAKQVNGISVAVTTGHNSAEKLKEAGADFVFPGVSHYKEFISEISSRIN